MKKLGEKTIIKNPHFELQFHKVELPSGKIIDDYVYFKANDGVMIIPVTEDNEIILLEHYKYAADATINVLPGGLSEDKEEPLVAAKRELLEESGYKSEAWELLGDLYTDPTNVAIKTYVYLAVNCKKVGEQNLDESEKINVRKISLETLFSLLKNNQIKDGPTLASLVLVYNKLTNLMKGEENG